MADHRGVLQDVLRTAKRRFLLPALPGDLEAAAMAGGDVLLAYCIESARLAVEAAGLPPASVEKAFCDALAQQIRRAADPAAGDPAFQAQVLHWRDASVREWAGLSATAASDARALRTAVDAFAHPGKLRNSPAESGMGERLPRLHDLAHAADWAALQAEAHRAAQAAADESRHDLQAALQALLAHPALARRLRMDALAPLAPVQRYRQLRAMRSPPVGSDAAIDDGRHAALAGARSEEAAAQALAALVALLNAAAPGGPGAHRLLRGLLTPAALAGADRAKSEWDAAIVRPRGQSGIHDVVLLAEAKAAPAAAATDLPRLLRGLARLAQAREDEAHDFACDEGSARLSGASLRMLQPDGHSIPAQVVYLCAAQAEARPALLGSAARALLLAEPASLEFVAGLAHAQGDPTDSAALAPVWRALVEEGRLRAVLHQYDSARCARQAMLHPDDLAAAVKEIGGGGRP